MITVVDGQPKAPPTEPLEDQRSAALHGLWAPTPQALIAQLPKGNVKLDYLGHADACRLIAAVDPYWQWAPSPEFALLWGHYEIVGTDEHGNPVRVGTPVVRNKDGYPTKLFITLTILDVTRPGIGTVAFGKGDPEKELIGDAVRNAAMRFGVGADLWSKAGGALDETADKRPTPPPPPPLAEPDPASDFKALGWKNKAEHDAWRASITADAAELDEADRRAFKAGWPQLGFVWAEPTSKAIADEVTADLVGWKPAEATVPAKAADKADKEPERCPDCGHPRHNCQCPDEPF